MVSFSLIVLLVVIKLGIRSSSFCPVTSNLELNNNGSFFYYPIDLFGSSVELDNKMAATIPCRTIDMTFPKVHKCPKTAGFCPVAKTNVHDAMQRSSPLARASICHIFNKLKQPEETVNFYVSGGSVTMGRGADECCNASECAFNELDHISCSWSYQLYHWMNKTYPANIHYVNFADHGHNSEVMVESLIEKFSELEMQPFTSNDIIFLDHSVNDNESGGASIATGFESLIRHLFYYSKPHDWPVMIVLDADPHKSTGTMDVNYSDIYERVARHYDIPVWSYRDAVLSNYGRNEQSQYSDFLTFERNFREDDDVIGTHPPWTVHWFMADLYASIWNHDTKHYCESSSIETQKLLARNANLKNRTFAQLPVPLSANATIIECSNKVLSFSYKAIVNHLSTVGQYSFDPPVGGWALRVDKPGRPGGFIVDNSTVDSEARMVFTLNITTEEFVREKKELQLIVQYLRSYDNGGVVQVTFCGQKIRGLHGKFAGILDGLWLDYQTHRFSLPDVWSPVSKLFSYLKCEGFSQPHPIIEFTYRYEPKARHRGQQKFKLLSITACVV